MTSSSPGLFATFALDFTVPVLDSKISLVRAGNTATRTNSSGYIEAVSANNPRFDYDPVTLDPKGLLIEEQRTNLLTYSAQFDNAAWTKINSASITVDQAVAPNGTQTADLLSCGATASRIQEAVTTVASTVYTSSVYAKAGAVNYVCLSSITASSGAIFNLLAGSVAATSGSSTQNITSVGNGWYRCSITYTSTGINEQVIFGASATATFTFGFYPNGSTGDTCYIWGAQVEAGSFATSYIPTTSAALTRNADVATITGSNFTSFWNSAQGGATVQATPSTVSGIRPLVQYDDGTANEIIALRGNTTNPELYIVDGGTPQAQLDAGTIAANTTYSLTGWWATNDCRARKDSGAAVTDATATIPTVTQARIGSDGTNYLNGTIATIDYYAAFSSQIYTRRKNKVFSSLF